MVANRLRDAAAVLEVDSAYRRDAAIMREAADEVDRLRHDIERHVEIACELATECERLRAELAECKREKNEALEALSDMVLQFFTESSDDRSLLSHSFMSAEEHAINVLLKYGRAEEVRRNRYRLIDAALAAGGGAT